MILASDSDQDEFDKQPPEFHEHLEKALLHHTGHGPHPGLYEGPQVPDTTTELAAEHMRETGPPEGTPAQGPLPPQEAVSQPMPGGGKKQGTKPPTQGTPTAIGAAAVKPEAPEGGF
jgi:hypothetical protein